MEEKITFGKFISKKRKELNLTQRELADKLYVTESAISKWERGISYPDITLISAICESLHISERELITASEDFKQREIEKQAKTYNTVKKTYLWIFGLSYSIAILTTFICNLAINHKLSWFFIVLTSITLAFTITVLPIILKKNKGIITLGAFFASLILLLMTCAIYTSGDWFWVTFISILFGFVIVFTPSVLKALPIKSGITKHKALITFTLATILLVFLEYIAISYSGQNISLVKILTIDAVTLPLAWIFLIIIRYTKINALFKTSILVFVSGFYTFFVNPLVDFALSGKKNFKISIDFHNWSTDAYINGNIGAIILITSVVCSIIFVIGGIAIAVKNNNRLHNSKK
ncbi:MAG: helix-turn-helix domain-containing protein [Clostridiales bacterium]|nr:helix-turn-helix domain-containing protein [Clostridiales bacterium]